jgi:hypothetical protein
VLLVGKRAQLATKALLAAQPTEAFAKAKQREN